MSAPRVVCVGLSCLDHVWRVERFPPRGSRTDASSYHLQGGGPAATAAVAAAHLGAHAALIALHGDDPAGETVLADLAQHGVDVSGVHRLPGARTFVSAVLVAPDGERWIFPYRGAGLDDDPALLPHGVVEGAGAVLVDMRHPRLCRAAASAARAAGVPVVADYGNLKAWEDAHLADHLLVSRECAEELLGRDDPETALPALPRRPDQVVGITLGADGVLLLDGDRRVSVPAPRVEAVDTTGAGDVFHGAYATAVARGLGAEPAAGYAATVAAMACRTLGARAGLPSDAEVAAFRQQGVPGADPARR
ncbi:MAG: PfkB family carbohydrate kinase [Deinococcales bacterium]